MARVINLCFHGIGAPRRDLDPGEEIYWISESLFLGVLDLVAGRSDVRISFDDGNLSDLLIGLPGLQDRSLRATFFPVAARLGQPGCVDADGVSELASGGMAIGSHGMHHRRWAGMSDEESRAELEVAPMIIAEAAGTAVTQVACPFGSYDPKAIRRLRQLNYVAMYTSDRASARPSSWRQPRFSVRAGDDVDTVRAILAAPRGGFAELRPQTSMLLKRWGMREA